MFNEHHKGGVPLPQEKATEEIFPLNPALQKLVRETFKKKEFEILEFTDTHVRIKNPQGKTKEVPNRAAVEFCGK